ncbi:MAG: serine/threonine protein kinase, partial [Myxococcaceae bacterium]
MTIPTPKKQPIPFGRYLLLDRINIGGMAEVWRGKVFGAGGFERLVAIKRILPNIAEDEEFISMFQDEAKISVQLTHANICQIYELNRLGPSLFIAMEYVPGKDLRSIFERARKKGEPPPVPLVCYVIGKLCEGLDYAHRKKDPSSRDLNVVHRDVSPQNVLISFEGEVKVIDFGIAKAAGKVTKTQAGILKGKFGYMSPEQIRGLPLDRRSDVFSIGVCLYELLTGERLFVGESDFQVLEKVRKAEVLPPSTYNRKIPEALERIVLKALAKDPQDRFQYGSELADELQRFLITSDSIFSRKDLMQYMKSTFAEEVERERARIAEYAGIKAPESMAPDAG